MAVGTAGIFWPVSISSGWLRVLLATEQQLEKNNGNMTVIHANENILEVFELAGFMDVITGVKN